MNASGPAFPTLVESGMDSDTGNKIYRYVNEGMSLRDYFAAQALPAVLIAMNQDVLNGHGIHYGQQDIAAKSYIIADMMLAEREKP